MLCLGIKLQSFEICTRYGWINGHLNLILRRKALPEPQCRRCSIYQSVFKDIAINRIRQANQIEVICLPVPNIVSVHAEPDSVFSGFIVGNGPTSRIARLVQPLKVTITKDPLVIL